MRLADVDRNSREALELAGEEVLPEGYRVMGGPLTVGQAKLWTAKQVHYAGIVPAALEICLGRRGLSLRSIAYPGTGERGPSWEEYCRIRDGAEEAGGEEKMWTTTRTTAPPVCWEWAVYECFSALSLENDLNSEEIMDGWEIWSIQCVPRLPGDAPAYLLIARRPKRDPGQSPRDPTDPGAPPE